MSALAAPAVSSACAGGASAEQQHRQAGEREQPPHRTYMAEVMAVTPSLLRQ